MSKYVHGDAPKADAIVDRMIAEVGREITELNIPHLAGVVLGGGYGRGEGGVFIDENGNESLSNDLDFFAITDACATENDINAITAALSPISARWTRELGVDVDFSPPKTPWRLQHDQDRLMVQELIHGYFDVAGKRGNELFACVELRDASALPWTEAVRLLVNRGAGLLFANETDDLKFVARNINKCVLGCGDAVLVVQQAYSWRIEQRTMKLCQALYAKAVSWKFRPTAEPVCTWEVARQLWLETVGKVLAAEHDHARTLWQAGRWLIRRHTLGNPMSLGYEPVLRILYRMRHVIEKRHRFPKSLKRDWELFN